MNMVVIAMRVFMIVFVRMLMTAVVMMFAVGVVMFGIVVRVAVFGVRVLDVVLRMVLGVEGFAVFLALIGLGDPRRIDAGVLHHLALDALAIAAATGVAMARTAAMAAGGAVLALFLGLAMGAFVG